MDPNKKAAVEPVVQSFLEPSVLAVIAAILAIFITTIYLLFRTGKKRDTVLIVGLSDSGKTQVFFKVVNKNAEPITTYTSLQENTVHLDIKGNLLKIIDFPGSDRLRKQLVEKWLKKEQDSLKKIVFVLDSSSFTKRARDVAEFLYDVALESSKKVPIVVACNKQDLSLAKGQEVISSTLEKEIGLINKSRAAALTTTDGSSRNATLTTTLDSFNWDDLNRSIEFVDCSAVGEPGLDELRAIIRE